MSVLMLTFSCMWGSYSCHITEEIRRLLAAPICIFVYKGKKDNHVSFIPQGDTIKNHK